MAPIPATMRYQRMFKPGAGSADRTRMPSSSSSPRQTSRVSVWCYGLRPDLYRVCSRDVVNIHWANPSAPASRITRHSKSISYVYCLISLFSFHRLKRTAGWYIFKVRQSPLLPLEMFAYLHQFPYGLLIRLAHLS